MRPIPGWSEIKSNARRLADRGRGGLGRASDRFQRFTQRPSDRPAWRASDPSPVAVLEPHEHRRRLAILGGGFLLLAAIIVVIIAIWDWNWFRSPLASYASVQTGRHVRIDGDLKVHLLTRTPVVSVNGLKIGEPSWAGQGDTAQVETLKVKVKLVPLIFGRVEVPSIELQKPKLHLLRDKTGRANWRFGRDQGDHPTRLPPIQQLTIRDGQIDFTDAGRKLHLLATIQSSEELTPAGKGIFRLTGAGSLNARPLALSVIGGPLIQVRRDRPYGFVADVRMGGTHVKANGAILKPFDFGRYQARLSVAGPDMADLYYLTGLAFPNTPNYHASGAFSRDGQVYRYSRFSGQVGASDLSGDIKVSKPKDRRLLEATLHSRALDLRDMSAVMGGGRMGTPEAGGRMFPDAPLNVDRLRSMDAKVTYTAGSVQGVAMGLSKVKLGINLEDALLAIDPVSLTFSRGTLAGSIRINARKATPVTDIDLTLRGYGLQNLTPAAYAGSLSGTAEGRLRLHGTGDSVHKAMASSTGDLRLAAPDGEIRQAFAELLGINVGKGLILLLNKDPKRTPIRCAVAHFNVEGGIARADRLVIDTGVVTSRGEGAINLGQETINLRFKGDSKKPRLLRLWAPITVQGPLARPKIGVETGGVAAQAGVGAALGALVSPLAAVLPFVDPGGKDVNCQALLAGR